MSISFTQIKPYKGSQNDAFEELVCQAIRRTEAENQPSWRRLEGAGGDGGVEAFWYREPGFKVGIQAKFFTKSGEVDWKQITGSFHTALKLHNDLKEYQIYIACDLTGPTGRKTRSGKQARSGLDDWNKVYSELKKHATNKGRDVTISLKAASDLLGILARPESVGLPEFWFGAIEITSNKLRSWLDSSLKTLGDRFHPEDHVEVYAQDLFRILHRTEGVKETLLFSVSNILSCDRLDVPEIWTDDSEKKKAILYANEAVESLSSFQEEVCKNISMEWPVEAWRNNLKKLENTIQGLIYASFLSRERRTTNNDELTYLRYKAEAIHSALKTLVTVISSKAFDAEMSRSAFIIGDAGSGKSHLLAAAAKEIHEDQGVCVFLLGQRFHQGSIWEQIAEQLGFPNTPKEKLLGALDAAACASGKRGLLIIDALNEGTLQWRNELEGFIDEVRAFSNLAIVLSCRDVYLPYVVTPEAQARFPIIEIRGFETEEEIEAAARIYIDKRGITRPPIPWLAPEFVNPLFLRSTCVGLNKVGKTEFPTGLQGIKELLKFYIETVAQNLGTNWDGGNDLIAPSKSALLAIARTMAENQKDWLEQNIALSIVENEFSTFPAPQEKTWLKVLIQNDIFREDPYPEEPTDNPLNHKPDVIRFAFQRFQDHLTAEALLNTVTDISGEFEGSGSLAFMLNKEGEPRWDWQGLIEALSIQVPEKFKMELIDALPGSFEHQWSHWNQRAFIQSVKWRERNAITDRTFELAHRLEVNEEGDDLLMLLVELAPQPDHPWNAELLDKNLRRWKLPVRDKNWTMHISTQGVEERHPINRLIDWCSEASKEKADIKVLYLSALTLCWSLTSSASWVRDRATKALSSLFTDRSQLFVEMLRRFCDLDDLYIVERLLAAGYGTLLRFPEASKAYSYAKVTWECFFAREHVPTNILLRDYARGIIDVSDTLGVLPNEINLEKVHPPYSSKSVILNATEERIKTIAKSAGGESILHSCGKMGDFQIYEVRPSINKISTTRLADSAPATRNQLSRQFEKEVRLEGGEKHETLQLIEQLIRNERTFQYGEQDEGSLGFQIDEGFSDAEKVKKFKSIESYFLSLLTDKQKIKYRKTWLPELLPSRRDKRSREPDNVETFAPLPVSRWIARRAYNMGWTKKLFGNDIRQYDSHYARNRPKVERIGKKYQWLARSELLSRLIDRYWLFENWDDAGARQYDNATDLSFERDIDPTLFSSEKCGDGKLFEKEHGLTQNPLRIEPLNGKNLLKWPFRDEPSVDTESKIRITDSNGTEWYRLAWYSRAVRRKAIERQTLGHNFAQQQFAFTHAIMCKTKVREAIIESLQTTVHIDIQDWSPIKYTDEYYLYELRRRNIWPKQKWHNIFPRFDRNKVFEVAFPAEKYYWESHLDSSLPKGADATVLSGWLMDSEKLELSPFSHQLIQTSDGEVVAWSSEKEKADFVESGIIVRADWFNSVLQKENLDCMWVITGERNAWQDDEQDAARISRRFNCISSLSEGTHTLMNWNEDNVPPEMGAL